MNKLIAMLALGTALAVGLVSVNAIAKEGSESSSEHVGSSGTSSTSSASEKSDDNGQAEDTNETEDQTSSGTVEQETESDDAPPVLPALKPIGTNVLQPLLLKKQTAVPTTIY